MIGICLATIGLTLALPVHGFTLSWTHSIEKILWQEDYQVVQAGGAAHLLLVDARIRGSGAGMEPPADARLVDGVWHYRPPLAPLPSLYLARSDFVADYRLCWDGQCHPMAELLGPPASAPEVKVYPCAQP